MRYRVASILCRPACLLFAALLFLSACARSYDETIAGVVVPVPKAMKRSAGKPSEISLFGFGAGQASFEGNMSADEIAEFYKKELPARGWQSSMDLRSGGALLAYSKEGKSLLIGVSNENTTTRLSLTIAGAAR